MKYCPREREILHEMLDALIESGEEAAFLDRMTADENGTYIERYRIRVDKIKERL